jgi:hypothetical protein
MTRAFNSPRAGSRAYRALEALHALGGSSYVTAWLKATDWCESTAEFERQVVGALTRARHIFSRNNQYVITDGGKARIGALPEAYETSAPAAPVAPRYVAPKADLSARHKVRLQPMREGAFDYLSIPSLYGSTRVDHKTSLTIACGDAA